MLIMFSHYRSMKLPMVNNVTTNIMKNTYILFLLCVLSGIFTISCQKQEPLMYSESPSVYFLRQYGAELSNDSTTFTFLGKADTVKEKTLLVGIRITGLAENRDRAVNVVVDPITTATLGTHFTIDPVKIPAGQYYTNVVVHLKRHTDLKTNIFYLYLKMQNSDEFKTGYDTKLKYKITFTEKAIKPSSWPQSYYGDYSDAKLLFMYQILGDKIDWGAMPPIHMANSALLRTELAKYEKINGPLIDAATGVRVTFPG
jgi:hypothetical protein